MGGLLLSLGEFAEAESYFKQALDIRRNALGEKHPFTSFSYGDLSLLHAARGEWTEAGATADQARRIVRRHVSRVLPNLSSREQARFLATKDEGPFHAALSLGLRRASDPRLTLLAAEWLLNGKAVAQEALAQRALLARQSTDAAEQTTVKELLSLRSQLATLTLSTPEPSKATAHRVQLQELARREEQLTRRIAERNGETFQTDPWVDVAAVRQRLSPDAVLVDIARFKVRDFDATGQKERWHPARYVAWVIPAAAKRQAVTIIDLGDADRIDQATQQVREAMQVAIGTAGTISQQGEPEAESKLRQPLEQLAKLVLEPIVDEVGDAKQLLLSPDAALWLVPWGRTTISRWSLCHRAVPAQLFSQRSGSRCPEGDKVDNLSAHDHGRPQLRFEPHRGASRHTSRVSQASTRTGQPRCAPRTRAGDIHLETTQSGTTSLHSR